jgi:GNAT superfamily N-acetyltransferase
MWWRLERAKWAKQQGEKNRRAFRKIVGTGVPTGVLAYLGQEPVGWCAIAPREHYSRLARSRVLSPVDDETVWSVTCFFVRKEHRRSGLTSQLLQAAMQYAHKQGAKIIEGYPQDPRRGEMPDAFGYTGFVSVFLQVGFEEVARRSATRPIMRLMGGG